MSSIALVRAYQQSFEAYPHCTLAIAGGALTALGDAVAQLSQYIVRLIFESHPLMLISFPRPSLRMTVGQASIMISRVRFVSSASEPASVRVSTLQSSINFNACKAPPLAAGTGFSS
jgi:hypothetical protein